MTTTSTPSTRRTIGERRVYNNRIARSVLGKPERVKYGPAEIERVDIYKTKRAERAGAVFIHGGSWRGGPRRAVHRLRRAVREGGREFRGGRFHQRAARPAATSSRWSTSAAARWPGPYRNAKSFGGNPDELYLISRSSGSHLASCVLITEWEKQGLPRNILKGAVMGSGMYDLAPVRLSKRSSFVKFTDAMVQDLSAMRHIDKIHTPVVIGVGALETPEFQRQAREFAAALKAAGKPHELIVAPGYNHYETGETIGQPYAVLGRAAMDMMGLNKA